MIWALPWVIGKNQQSLVHRNLHMTEESKKITQVYAGEALKKYYLHQSISIIKKNCINMYNEKTKKEISNILKAQFSDLNCLLGIIDAH